MVFDPAVVDLQKLLTVFWENHDPTTPYRSTGFSSQYRSAIFTTSPEQHQAAVASKEHYQARLRDRGYSKIHTEITEAGEFYYAEDYHQQYMHTHPRALCGRVLPGELQLGRPAGNHALTFGLSHSAHAPVAQLDRVPGFEPGGWGFKSLRACKLHRPWPPHDLGT